jgi:DNA-binding MarR family transcriptional regulator
VTGDGAADPLDRRLTAALERLSHAQRMARVDAAYRLGLSPTQLAVLQLLAAAPPGRRTAAELATELEVTAPTMSGTVAALRRKDLVTEELGVGRRRPLRLTRKGAMLVRRADRALEPLRSAVSALSQREQGELLEAALRLIAALQRAGIVTVARMCTTCRFFDDARPVPRCRLLQVELPPEALRVDCPDHEPAA